MNPIFLSAITTFVGFGSFAVSRISWTRTFGIFTSIGVALALLLSIVLLPIMLSFDMQYRNSKKRKQNEKKSIGFWKRYRTFVENPYQWIILISVIIIIGVIGFLRVRVEGNPIDMFPADSDIRQADALVAKHLGGTRFLWIELENNQFFLANE